MIFLHYTYALLIVLAGFLIKLFNVKKNSNKQEIPFGDLLKRTIQEIKNDMSNFRKPEKIIFIIFISLGIILYAVGFFIMIAK